MGGLTPGSGRGSATGAAPSLVALLLLLLVACGSGSDVARDPGADDANEPGGARLPSSVPAAAGEVRTRGVVTVLDSGGDARVCLGAVAESWPPQCSGPPLVGWDWRRRLEEPGQPAGATAGDQQAGGVRWGRYALVGRWDGERLTVTTAVPEAQHVPQAEEQQPLQDVERPLPEEGLRELAEALLDRVPGALSAHVEDGRVHLSVIHDDGTIQEWADAEHGSGLVVVTSMLVEVD
jgi:hypothetical protein